MPKLSKESWVTAGINQLKEYGPAGVSGEKIARRLDVTRGSFYHHFDSMDELTTLMLEYWERTQTIEIFDRAQKQIDDLHRKMTILLESAWNSDADLEIAMRQWAFSNPIVQAHVERIDRVRLSLVSAVYIELTQSESRGNKLGKIAYYGLLGALHAWPRFTKDQLKETVLEIQALLTEEAR
ncbi:MAG: TetR/AcrR family transcriptional regulator [Pseudomonadota bacterium]|nr:TetR/AcrR family transcriptional regulator [Pseudomonadota bacterium]